MLNCIRRQKLQYGHNTILQCENSQYDKYCLNISFFSDPSKYFLSKGITQLLKQSFMKIEGVCVPNHQTRLQLPTVTNLHYPLSFIVGFLLQLLKDHTP